MTCLLLRLAGPMQSWGHQSRFSDRDTGREPTRSGVVGLLCAALGVDRDSPIPDGLRLERLRMGVRVDREGVPARDYHTAGGGTLGGRDYGVLRASGKPGETVLSNRHYLADAEFLVALEPRDPETDDPLPDDAARPILEAWRAALASPVWPLFLGRKSFTPAFPLDLGIHDTGLEATLRTAWFYRRSRIDKIPDDGIHKRSRYDEIPEGGLRLVLELPPRLAPDQSPEGHARRDVPESFALGDRRYSVRYVDCNKFVPKVEVRAKNPPTNPEEFRYLDFDKPVPKDEVEKIAEPAPAHPEREFPRCTSPA